MTLYAAIITSMKKLFSALPFLLLALSLRAADQPKLAPLPLAVSNNAVAISHEGKESKVFSFMGMGAKKTWDAITNRAFQMDLSTGKWTEVRPAPGVAGRLGAAAASVKDLVFLFGGYVVDSRGGEDTLSDMNIFVPAENRWYRGEDIPVPVDDSVIGVYRDRYVYLVGGWSKTGAVSDVQIYDAEKNKWMKGTPIPGTPVFGHAGAISGETIIYVDGVYEKPGANPKYVASDECWMGKITKGDVTKIEWTKLPVHPGNARYRIAAGNSAGKEGRVYFSGGTDNPYNFNGVGYNGQPSEPSPVTFAYNVRAGKWEVINENTPDSTMDHRGLLVTSHGLVIVGGMNKGQQVSANVRVVKATPAK